MPQAISDFQNASLFAGMPGMLLGLLDRDDAIAEAVKQFGEDGRGPPDTGLSHAAGGTAAGCIAAGICEPLTLRAVVSISCSNHRDDCNLSVTSVCGSPPPPPVGAQCELTKQVSHLLCVKNKTFGCYSNGTMWTSDVNGARCMGIFDCAGVSAVDRPGTGTASAGG